MSSTKRIFDFTKREADPILSFSHQESPPRTISSTGDKSSHTTVEVIRGEIKPEAFVRSYLYPFAKIQILSPNF